MMAQFDRVKLDLPILHETAHEIAIVKPAGMATELSDDRKGASLLRRVIAAAPCRCSPHLPHRLDRISRGIVVVALTEASIAHHNRQIREQRWDKIYLARCVRPQNRGADRLVGLHKLHLRPTSVGVKVVRSGGSQAVTEILAAAPVLNLDTEMHVLLRLHTGRRHQIRATLAHLGAPLVDDWLYGTSPGRSEERFYLEHVALRFIPYGRGPQVLHWKDDPDREVCAAVIDQALRSIMAQWIDQGALCA